MGLVARLVEDFEVLLARQPRVLVAIDGPDAAGKTMLADAVAQSMMSPAVRASIDGFHNPRATRLRRGPLSAEGYYRDSFFNHDVLKTHLLEPFARGASEVKLRYFDYRRDIADDVTTVEVPVVAALIVDGVFLLRRELRSVWDRAVYLDVPPGESVRRAKVRDLDVFGSAEQVEQRYRERYLPGQRLYRDEASPQSSAQYVVDNSNPREPIVLRAPS